MLFEDNLGFINFAIQNSNPPKKTNQTPVLTSIEDGFARGNMFDELYKPYKNYRYALLNATSKRDELLTEIMALSFALNDLGLYLDLHPNDTEILNKFRIIAEKSCEKEMKFVKEFGPLEMIDDDKSNKYSWIKNPWPWESDGGVKYV